jgi:arylsulfatase A-like enzyme
MILRLLSVMAISTATVFAQPNVLWFVVDDMSANLSCYGEKTIKTPHLDALAAQGQRFTRAFTTAPVCSPCRSGLITGMYQTSIGGHHHRSGRGELKITLPEPVQPLPKLMQQAGYYTCIGSGLLNQPTRKGKKQGKAKAGPMGKTDYNFEWDAAMYHSHDWQGRRAGQAFFMQVQLAGGKLREGGKTSQARAAAEEQLGSSVAAADVVLPPYYPRDPVLLDDWAAYLDAVRLTDHHVGQVIARLQSEGLLENTLIIFMTDHGISHARGKQFLYNEGTHIPLIISGPGVPKGVERQDFALQIDLAPTTLAMAGLPVPGWMQGQDLFSKTAQPRAEVFAARDRCDETVEHLRSVRTDKYLYIRNGYPQRPALQPNRYKDGKAIVQKLRELHGQGSLPDLSERLLFAPTRPVEELYAWTTDGYQLTNLASDQAHEDTLVLLRGRLDAWIQSSGDKGRESEANYDSDMAVYSKEKAGNDDGLSANIALMKQWAKGGK